MNVLCGLSLSVVFMIVSIGVIFELFENVMYCLLWLVFRCVKKWLFGVIMLIMWLGFSVLNVKFEKWLLCMCLMLMCSLLLWL